MGSLSYVTLSYPAQLRSCCGGAAELHLEASSVRDLLADLAARYPELHRNLCDESGALRRHLNLFVNAEHMRDREGLDTRLAPGDVLYILPAVSGG